MLAVAWSLAFLLSTLRASTLTGSTAGADADGATEASERVERTSNLKRWKERSLLHLIVISRCSNVISARNNSKCSRTNSPYPKCRSVGTVAVYSCFTHRTCINTTDYCSHRDCNAIRSASTEKIQNADFAANTERFLKAQTYSDMPGK